ncbi:type I polyketide synthase-like protein, partial [Leptotrombidium deliense]
HVIASKTGVNEALDSFIANGTVDNSLIDNYNEWNYSPSIPLSLFRSVRHWPEERNEEDVEIQTNHMNEKVCVKQLLEKQMLEVRELVHSVDLAPKPAVQDTIDRFAVAYIGRFFRECSFSQYWKVGKSFTTFEFFKLTNIHERYFSLFRAILKHLSKCGIIRSNEIIYDNLPVNFTILIGLNDDRFNEDPDAIAEYGIEAFPNHQDCFKLPLYCMKHFKDVVTGDLSPLTVLYPKGDLGFTSRHEMIGDPMGSIYMRKNIQTIAKYVKKLAKQSNNKIRVLEAGAGLGLITRQLVPKLCKLENVEYWFTDIGNAFVSHAEKLFSPISNRMKFHVFDITKPAAEQGIYEQFDVIVAYNVVHVTESLLQTAGNLCSTLNDTGVMFLLENTKNNIWATLTWGILDGWWFFKDYELRSEVLCTAENWERTLKKLDFQTIYSCPTNEDERRYVEKYMFVCCKENFEKLEDVEGWWEKVELRFEDTLIPKKQDDDEVNKLVKKLNYNEVVVLLKQIWKELLGVDAEDDDIFRDLGGESLLAIQMMFQVRDEIGVDLELAHCYAYPSLKELANFILTLIEQSMSNEHSEEENTSGVETELIETEVSVETSEVSDNENALLMFCGQGAHKDSMFNSLVKDEICMQVFNEAEQILGFDILEEF